MCKEKGEIMKDSGPGIRGGLELDELVEFFKVARAIDFDQLHLGKGRVSVTKNGFISLKIPIRPKC